jgi:predicted RNase H-like nuclease (RuvC/YqgF family)
MPTVQVKIGAEIVEALDQFVETMTTEDEGGTKPERRGRAVEVLLTRMPLELSKLREHYKSQVDSNEELSESLASTKQELEKVGAELKKQVRIASHLSELFVYATGGTPGER